jgi:hypothetical protein
MLNWRLADSERPCLADLIRFDRWWTAPADSGYNGTPGLNIVYIQFLIAAMFLELHLVSSI